MKWNLKARVLVPTLLIILVGMGVSAFLSFKQSEELLRDVMLEQAEQVAINLEKQVNSWISDIRLDLSVAADNVSIQKAAASSGLNASAQIRSIAYLQRIEKEYAFYEGVGVIDAEGKAIAHSDSDQLGKLSVANYPFFKQAMQGNTVISKMMYSPASGKPIIVVAVPVSYSGMAVGMIAGFISLDKFSSEFIAPVKMGKTGYAFVVDSRGVVVSHPDSSTIMKTNLFETDWGKKIQAEKQGIVEYTREGVRKIVSFMHEPVTGWTIGIGTNVNDIFSAVSSIRTSSMITTAGVTAVAGIVVFFIVNSIVAVVRRCVEFAEAVAAGDLDQKLAIDRGDEIGLLANALTTMVTNLREMISMAEQKTQEAEAESERARVAVDEATEARNEAEQAKRQGMLQAAVQLEEIVEHITTTATELSAQVDEASRGSELQLERTGETATAIEQMNATVLEVARNATSAASHAVDTKGKAEEGEGVVASVVEAIDNVSDRSKSLTSSLGNLGDRAEDIGSVMTVITDIADQTNLLALNAAIEAARAGEAGRGFAVVADEVRKLAEKTMQATREVEEAIKAIQQASRENIQSMNETSEMVEQSTKLANVAGDSLRAIVQVAVANADQVNSIASASEEQSATSEQIGRSSDEINRIAMETASSMRESAVAVNDLAMMTQKLQALIEELKA